MRDGLRLVCTGVEMVNNKIGLLDLEGWSSEVCQDLSKHDQNLSRIYRKYWRRGQSTNPELDIAASLFASMGMYHFKQKMSKKIVNGGSSRQKGNMPPPFGGLGGLGGLAGMASGLGGMNGFNGVNNKPRNRTPEVYEDSEDEEEGLPP